MLCVVSCWLSAQTTNVPAWAQPGSATHVEVAPPADFYRPAKNFDTPIGLFDGQSDSGSTVVPGSAGYDVGTKQYTINSVGYNVWYMPADKSDTAVFSDVVLENSAGQVR